MGPAMCSSNSFSSTNSGTTSSKGRQSSKNKHNGNNKHTDYRGSDTNSEKGYQNNKNISNFNDNDHKHSRDERRNYSGNQVKDVDRFITRMSSHHIGRNSMCNDDKHRHYNDTRVAEPEWFSSGPTSQHDTVELRGFDDRVKSKEFGV